MIGRFHYETELLALEFGSLDMDDVLPRVVLVGHGTAMRLVFRDTFGLIKELHQQGECQEVIWPPKPASSF